MFSNLSWYEVVALLLLALFIFGDKLPRFLSEGLRMLRNLRRMAQNATTDLSRELGTDIQLEDLHPRAFVRKHLLSEADQEKLLSPLKGASDDLVRHTREVEQEVKDLGRRTEGVVSDAQEATSRRDGHAVAAPRERPGRAGAAGQGVGTAAAAEPPAPAQQPGPAEQPVPEEQPVPAEQPAPVGDAPPRLQYEDIT